jgi:hypothetical protein
MGFGGGDGPSEGVSTCLEQYNREIRGPDVLRWGSVLLGWVFGLFWLVSLLVWFVLL